MLPDFLWRLLAKQIHVEPSEQADSVAVSFDPCGKWGDSIFIRVLGVDTRDFDKIIYYRKDVPARVKQERLAADMSAKRLADLISAMKGRGFEPKRMRLVYSREYENAKLALIEGVKGGGIEMEILKPLYIYDEKGDYTFEIEEMYK